MTRSDMSVPTPEDVGKWNIEVLHDIAEQVERSDGARSGIATRLHDIRNDQRTTIFNLDWSGAARESATGRVEEEWQDIGRIIAAYAQIGQVCRDAYAELRDPVVELQAAIRRYAEGTLAPDWTVRDLGDPTEESNASVRLRGLAEGVAHSDALWAPKISAAIDDLRTMAPTEAGAINDAPARPDADQPPQQADPEQTRAWWDGLTAEQQDFLLATQPHILGALDGLPARVRDRANRSLLDSMQQELEQELANEDKSQLRIGIQNKIDDLAEVRQVLDKHADRGEDTAPLLLVLDKDQGAGQLLTAIAFGNPDESTHVSVTTPGMNTNPSDSLDGMAWEAIHLQEHSEDLLKNAGREGESVATVAWIGYEPPQNVSLDGALDDPLGAVIGAVKVSSDAAAEDGAVPLAQFYDGIAVSQQAADNNAAHITAIGHSYGSVTTSHALQQLADQGKTPVDEVILYGSPGLGGDRPDHDTPHPNDPLLVEPEDYGLEPGRVFAMAADGDKYAQFDKYGFNPIHTPGWLQLETDTTTIEQTMPDGEVVDRTYDGVSGHSGYPRHNFDDSVSISVHNLAAVLTNLDDQVRLTGRNDPRYYSGPNE